jgi:two-component system cell cycle sensor histidine kinase/response regulator CckA
MREITARKKLIKENKRLTAQFYNYQKLQSVGRLAEGIAHDFNNMLSVIQMNIDLVRGKLNPMDTTYLKIQQISLATEHAAALTHQLLAFSRNEVLLPSIFNLNNLINNLNPMLDSLFSSNIVLSRDLQEDLWLMKGDASQLEQVILNLSFNASDAMPQGGRLVIKTSNVPRDALSSHADPDLDGRPWILFEVLDTGSGIDPVTIRRIFEPFSRPRRRGRVWVWRPLSGL